MPRKPPTSASKLPISTTYETEVRNIANNKAAKLLIQSKLTGHIIEFPAFLTSFNQAFTSTWNEEDVYGRMDPIATFQNTKRSVSLAFDLPSANIQVAMDNLVSCDKLAQFLYPGYLPQTDIRTAEDQTPAVFGNVISRPPLVAVKFANLLSPGSGYQLGYMLGLDWTPALDMGMFSDGKNNLYPKVISLSFTLNVLHQGDKGVGQDNKWLSSRFFGGEK
jgi:hypothetical protein